MEKKPIQAKNVVSYKDGKRVAKPVKKVTAVDSGTEDKEIVVSEEVPLRTPSEPEAFETRPLNLRQDRYLDEEPQEPDWADERGDFDDAEDYEADTDEQSTFAEVFLPLQGDSTGTVVRKGLAIVSLIVILCCIVAILMKVGSIDGTIAPRLSELPTPAAMSAAVPLFIS